MTSSLLLSLPEPKELLEAPDHLRIMAQALVLGRCRKLIPRDKRVERRLAIAGLGLAVLEVDLCQCLRPHRLAVREGLHRHIVVLVGVLIVVHGGEWVLGVDACDVNVHLLVFCREDLGYRGEGAMTFVLQMNRVNPVSVFLLQLHDGRSKKKRR